MVIHVCIYMWCVDRNRAGVGFGSGTEGQHELLVSYRHEPMPRWR